MMGRDALRMRGERPFVMTNLKAGAGDIARFIVARGGLADRLPETASP
jgi:urease accessory protein